MVTDLSNFCQQSTSCSRVSWVINIPYLHLPVMPGCVFTYSFNNVVVLLCNSHLFLVIPNMGNFYLIVT